MAMWTQLLVALLGGIIGGFGSKFLWNYHRRPILEIRGVKARKSTSEEGDFRTAEYSIEIHNKGKSAAMNCRTRFRLEGRHNQTLDTASTEGLDDVEHVAHGYEASYNLPWREGAKPESITINRGETVELDLLTVNTHPSGREVDINLEFPHDPATDDDTGPIQKREWGIDQGTTPLVEMVDRIGQGDFEQIPWETIAVEFSGENIEMTARNLRITWDRSALPDVRLE